MNFGDSSTFFLVIEQYQLAYEKALEIMNVFEDASIDELIALKVSLEKEIEKFLNMSGLDWKDCGSLGRHLSFMSYYFDRNQREGAQSDIDDIIFHDLPAGLRALISNQSMVSHYDQKLKDAVLPLIQGKHYDSAIRKAFIILTDRLRRAFGIKEELDGEALVNSVFGKGGTIIVRLDDVKKQSYRNFISGFYGVYRNKFAHHDVEPTLSEVKAILEMTNNIILEIEEISSKAISETL